MRPTFTKFLYLVIFLGLSYGAKAQQSAVPDTTRYSVGLDAAFPTGKLNNGYLYGTGISAQIDIPLTTKWYLTGNVGYNTFFTQKSQTDNGYAIAGVKEPALDLVPIKIGFKYFLIRTFYLQVEGGESLILNKSSLYAYQSTAITFAPQAGLLFKLNHKQYIDFGVRFQWFQDFYGNDESYNAYNRFWGLRFAYGFNLK
jgi:hypothetical protein